MWNRWLAWIVCATSIWGWTMLAAEKPREWRSGQVVDSKGNVGPNIHTITATGKNYLVRGSVGGDEDALAVGTTVRFAVEGKTMFISLEGKEYHLNVLGETVANSKGSVAAPAAVALTPAVPATKAAAVAPPPPAQSSAPPAPPSSAPPNPAPVARTPQAVAEPVRRSAPLAKPTPEAKPPLDNDAVVKMILAGLQDDTITRVIAAQPGKYVLTPEALTGLKAAGVSADVIAAMSAKMNAQH